jgi:hypothetical protein
MPARRAYIKRIEALQRNRPGGRDGGRTTLKKPSLWSRYRTTRPFTATLAMSCRVSPKCANSAFERLLRRS